MMEQQPSAEQVPELGSLPGMSPPDEMPVVARPIPGAPAPTGVPARLAALDLSMISWRDAALDLLLALVVVLSPYVFNLIVAPAVVEVERETLPSATLLQAQKLMDVLVAGVLLVYLAARHRVPLQAFGVRGDGLGVQIACAPLALLGVYASLIAMAIVVGAIVLFFPETQSDLAGRYKLMNLLADRSVAQTIALMIPVAIHEEIIFRGLLIPYLRRLGMGWVGAALISSAVFASLHGLQGWLGMFQIFFLGVSFAAAFILTRSLLVVVLAHFAFNTIQVLMTPILLRLAEQAGGIPGT